MLPGRWALPGMPSARAAKVLKKREKTSWHAVVAKIVINFED
jgi:hypothetical protein